jgi:hypothetical protein
MKPEVEMSPGEWLDYQRSLHGIRAVFSIDQNVLEDFLKRVPEPSRAKAREVWLGRRGTRTSEVFDELMEYYLAFMKPVLTEEQGRAADATFFGVLPTYDFDGYTGRTPRGDRFVILHNGLGGTVSFWADWHLRTMEDGVDPLGDAGRLLDALRLMSALWYGRKEELPREFPDIYPRSEDYWGLAECLTLSAVSFVIGHEIGHIVGNHGAYGHDRAANHEIEFAADQVGLGIALRQALLRPAMTGGDSWHVKFMLYGPLFALAVMSLLGGSASFTHPAPSARRDRLIDAYSRELEAALGDKVDHLFSFVDHDVLSMLDKNSRGLFARFKLYREILDEYELLQSEHGNDWIRADLKARPWDDQ